MKSKLFWMNNHLVEACFEVHYLKFFITSNFWGSKLGAFSCKQ